jgi:predicted ATPase
MLLIMDNFEHLLAGVDLVTAIWQAAPHVRILVTSRERLHLQAEQVFQIEGLDFPEKGSVTTVDAYTAVQLFLQSARRNQFGFTLQESDDLNTVGHICRLADGIPLAIELIASWIDRLSLANIAAELQQGIELLVAVRRDMPERHRSIRAAFAYSWQMLEKNEQAVFAQLSVFRGGFTSQAAQEITGGDLPTLSQLAHKSFLQYDQAQERYQIHELMRQFGAEKLAKNEALAVAAHDRHSDFYCRALQQGKMRRLVGRDLRARLAKGVLP